MFLMWSVMMVAMMIPTAAPMILVFANVNRRRQEQERPHVPTVVFLGSYCTGCCWFLMALLFVTGVMNLLWVASITAFVLVEKAVPRGDLIGRLAGVVLILIGLIMFSQVWN